MMLMAGADITNAGDTLKKIHESYLFQRVKHPRPEILSEIAQLRIVRSLDAKQYVLRKKHLPYFVCGVFSPPFRKKENFAYIDRFVVDIDCIEAKGLSLEEVKSRIVKDERVLMCFISPSEDGLKVLFKLAERCYDHGIYSVFYKEFLRNFSARHGLEQVVDAKTCDVTRACFISVDDDVYYNADAAPVNMEAYVDISNPSEFFSMARESPDEVDKDESDDRSADPDEDTMARIKALLNPKLAKAAQERPVYVPEQINMVMDGLRAYIEEAGLSLNETISIQYGKKLRISLGLKQAEVNLFFGRRGFSVVVSPRCGTDSELNELAAGLIRSYIDEIA